MAFQSDQRIKVQIITALGADQIFRLLSDSDINIVMKTLGLLRNEVAHKSQIDHVMGLFGKLIFFQINQFRKKNQRIRNNPDLCLLIDSYINIVMKTLGLLRYEVAHKNQIDKVYSVSLVSVKLINLGRNQRIRNSPDLSIAPRFSNQYSYEIFGCVSQ